MKLLTLTLALLMASPAYASLDIETLPARISCPVIRVLYKHYADQGYSQAQMAAFMRSKGISEPKIAKLAQCIKQA